jgi:hypothetical protein
VGGYGSTGGHGRLDGHLHDGGDGGRA